jgi:hypothetical protein
MNKQEKVVRYDTETEEEYELWLRVLDMAEHIDKGEGFVYGDLYEDERI